MEAITCNSTIGAIPQVSMFSFNEWQTSFYNLMPIKAQSYSYINIRLGMVDGTSLHVIGVYSFTLALRNDNKI